MRPPTKIKFALLAATLLALSACNSDAAGYTSPAIPFPNLTLATATATNLANGWTNSTTVTNVTILYNGNGGFTSTTNITTNAVVTFANFSALNQRNVGLEFSFTLNGAGTDAYIIWIARSVDGVNYDTAQNLIVSFPSTGTTQVNGITNIDMLGFGYGRIVTVSNASARTLTNNAWSASQITSGPSSASAK